MSTDENWKQVHHPAYHEYDASSAPHVLDRQSIHAPQVVLNGYEKIPVTGSYGMKKYDESTSELQDSSKVMEPASELHHSSKATGKPKPGQRKRILIGIAICATLIIIVAAAIIGGVLGSVKARSNHTSASSSTGTTPPEPTNTGFQGPGNAGPNTVNDAWAYNGTSLAALTFSTTKSDTSGTNYIVFYQHSNGDIRQAIYNNTVWHDSEFVTADAHLGTPLSAYWKGDDFELYVFYFDKNRVLQEIRGKHGSDQWLNGTIGSLSLTSETPSSLSVMYPGACGGVQTAWTLYHTGIGTNAQMVYWNGDTDTWAAREVLDDFKENAGFAGHNNDGVWAIYYTSDKNSQLKELVCPDCCTNSSSTGWTAGGIAVANAGPARLVYYPASTGGTINELNNTLHYPDEVWVEDVSSLGVENGGNSGTFADPTADVGPAGVYVANGIPNGQVAMAPGFRGTRQQLWLFYQKNGTDVSVQIRDADAAGQWSDPQAIPVGR